LDALIERQLDVLRQHESPTESSDGAEDATLPTVQTHKSSAAESSRDSHAITHNGAHPAGGTQARRRRGGRP
jgi:hypothetical protein